MNSKFYSQERGVTGLYDIESNVKILGGADDNEIRLLKIIQKNIILIFIFILYNSE